MVVWRSIAVLLGLLALTGAATAAPQKATFSLDVATVTWPLTELDAQLPTAWGEAEFLVVEFRASTSQRFELGLISDEATAAQLSNGLSFGLLLVPVASLLTGFVMLVANRRVAAFLLAR